MHHLTPRIIQLDTESFLQKNYINYSSRLPNDTHICTGKMIVIHKAVTKAIFSDSQSVIKIPSTNYKHILTIFNIIKESKADTLPNMGTILTVPIPIKNDCSDLVALKKKQAVNVNFHLWIG